MSQPTLGRLHRTLQVIEHLVELALKVINFDKGVLIFVFIVMVTIAAALAAIFAPIFCRFSIRSTQLGAAVARADRGGVIEHRIGVRVGVFVFVVISATYKQNWWVQVRYEF